MLKIRCLFNLAHLQVESVKNHIVSLRYCTFSGKSNQIVTEKTEFLNFVEKTTCTQDWAASSNIAFLSTERRKLNRESEDGHKNKLFRRKVRVVQIRAHLPWTTAAAGDGQIELHHQHSRGQVRQASSGLFAGSGTTKEGIGQDITGS